MNAISNACARCQKNRDLKRCSRCKSISYCSKDCQIAHWKTHKPSCEPLSGSNASQSVSRSLSSDSNAKFQDGRNPTTLPRSAVPDDSTKSEDGLRGKPEGFVLDEPSASQSSSTQVWGVKLLEGKSRFLSPVIPEERFVPEFFDTSHPIFHSGELCPLTALYSIPIIIYSPTMARRQDGAGNQPAVYLRIEPKDGFAPFHWQVQSPGTCYAVRQDRKPLGVELLETMYEFHASLLSSDYFEKTIERRSYQITPKVFKTFSDKYWKSEKEQGRTVLSAVDGSDGV